MAWICWIAFRPDEGEIVDSNLNIIATKKLFEGRLLYFRRAVQPDGIGITGCGLLRNLQSDGRDVGEGNTHDKTFSVVLDGLDEA